MKTVIYILLFFTTSLFAQQYDKKWDKIVTLESEGRIKSASKIVDKIYKNASENNDEGQLIKCFFYKSKYLQTLEEDAQGQIINNLQSQIKQASAPTKAILNLVYAKCLTTYFSRNSYKLYSRTKTDSISSNFLTWSNVDFEKNIVETYEKTIENEAVLKNTPLEKYELVFDFNTIDEFKKLTLYDYLLIENIDYYKDKIHRWEIQSKNFEAIKPQLLGDSKEFITLDLNTTKIESLKKVLTLYQKIEIANPTITNEFERIKFCNTSIFDSKADFLKVLNEVSKKTSDANLLAKIQLEKATCYTSLASKKEHPDYNQKAIAVCDSVINSGVKTNSYQLALAKKQEILSKTLSVQLEKYTYPNQNTRANIDYKNVTDLTVSFYKIDAKKQGVFEKQNKNLDSLYFDFTVKNKPQKETKHKLVDKKDYFNHTTEILLPQLEKGNYLVGFESVNNENIEKAFAYQTITVTDFSVLARQIDNTENYVYVLDRKTGIPIENVALKLKDTIVKTNKNGLATFFNSTKNNYYNDEPIEFTDEKDTLVLNKNYFNRQTGFSEDDSFRAKVNFYLDRAIYRPGQKVFYKGIVVQQKANQTSVVPNLLLKVSMQDANDDDFKTLEVTTNEFGSFSGEFELPKTGLTGDFRIIAEEPDDLKKDPKYDKIKDEHPFWDNANFEESQITFKVEEYKRPKFEITFDPIKTQYSVNQSIKVNGNAIAFAGSSISDAKVTYTIYRATRNSYWSYYDDDNEKLVDGETVTDGNGKFIIDFQAKPNENADKTKLPVFIYKIEATVTDSNGETHSSEISVKVGYHTLVLNANIKRILNQKEHNTIELLSTNLNGQFVSSKGELKWYLQQEYNNKFKPRGFQKPEMSEITDADFAKFFPYENNDNSLNENENGTLVYTLSIDTNKDKTIPIDFISNFKSGNYKMVFSATDNVGNLIENKTSLQLFQTQNMQNQKDLIVIEQINKNPKADGFVTLQIKSLVPELYLFTTGNYIGKVFFEEPVFIKNNEATIKIPLKNNFENGVTIGFEGVFENHYFNKEFRAKWEEIQPKMEIEVSHFRNKIEPGSLENWSFQFSKNSDKTASEILASMYDLSLDKFQKRDWESLGFNNFYERSSNLKSSLGFTTTSAYLKNLNPYIKRLKLDNESTNLMWFGFDFNDSNIQDLQTKYKKQLTKKIKKPKNAKTISGVVKGDNLPLPGVFVLVKGTQRGATTDFDGSYEIEAATGEELVFSYLGYNSKTIAVTSNELDVKLKEAAESLHEVVVVGYGSSKKKALTGAVQVLEEVDEEVNLNISGKISGVALGSSTNIRIRGANSVAEYADNMVVIDGVISNITDLNNLQQSDILAITVLKGDKAVAIYGAQAKKGAIIITTKKALEGLTQVKARKNLSETAFFFPNLTDEKGKFSFNFTSPEALTAWKLRLLAHNKKATVGYLEKTVLTQKELMIMPNFPRFFREKDSITITAKIANMTKDAKTGVAMLHFFDATTMQNVDAKMGNSNNVKNFTITSFGNTTVSWKIYIPEGLQGVQYKVLAKSGNFSDGEENILPVLTNNILVTESIPIWVRENSKKEYTFDNLKNNISSTLQNHQITLEYTSNPAWIAIKSLPYLMEFEHECAEQTFARFYANALASTIINSNPKIASVFESWQKNGKLNARLEENEALKSIILAETPWLNDAQSEDEKKKNLALMFDLNKLKTSQETTFDKLKKKQNASGGFSWFDGGQENEYITRHILAGFGHLSKVTNDNTLKVKISEISKKGINYLDTKFLEKYRQNIESQKDKTKIIYQNNIDNLHYLYTRSFYLFDYPLNDTLKKATKAYIDIAKNNWLNYSLYEKGLAALTLNRFGESIIAKNILQNLKETASNNEDWGMYWIANKSGWYWNQAPIETQALLIEAFAEITNDAKAVNAMKVWLLKNKQTQNWSTTKATTEAVYALLMQGSDWLSVKDNTVIKLGDEKIFTKKLNENQKEAETGYLNLTWKKAEISKNMATIAINNKSNIPAYGGVYWQYFEDLDKIKNNSNTSLSISKELFLKKNTEKGEELQKLSSKNSLSIGDLVTVRLIITSKEDVEFIHLKDMRAACFEPTAVLSEYKYNNGLGYYMSTKDAATHFFFDRINKGIYVLEYDIRVNNKGDFSNGITTIQSMYAPEFSSHTKGIRLQVKE